MAKVRDVRRNKLIKAVHSLKKKSTKLRRTKGKHFIYMSHHLQTIRNMEIKLSASYSMLLLNH